MRRAVVQATDIFHLRERAGGVGSAWGPGEPPSPPPPNLAQWPPVTSKIYTRTGDDGTTGLWGGRRLPKHHGRVSAYGEVDELNSAIGAALAALPKGPKLAALRSRLDTIQRELFVVGAVLACDRTGLPADMAAADFPAAAARLEAEIDAMTTDLKPLKKFIMPGGSAAGAALHLARAICRRAERAATALAVSERVPADALVYLNRLSDHLFTAARWANDRLAAPETTWEGLGRR